MLLLEMGLGSAQDGIQLRIQKGRRVCPSLPAWEQLPRKKRFHTLKPCRNPEQQQGLPLAWGQPNPADANGLGIVKTLCDPNNFDLSFICALNNVQILLEGVMGSAGMHTH